MQSNCLSVVPLETEFGRKRMIDQSSCNKDFSCLKGFCPSFITVDGAKLAKRGDTGASRFDAQIADLPEPQLAGASGVYDVLVTGIGGTGVLTVGAVLGMAAHLEGKGCTVMDQTGMAQKGGAVTSHLRVAPRQDELFSPRLDVASADLILACDMVVAAYPDVLKTVKPGMTKAVLNRDVSPTGEFQTNRDLDLNPPQLEDIISAALAGGAAYGLNASKLATSLTGDSIATNFLMVGFALQKGLLPVSRGAIEEAIRLNGSNVSGNLRTLGLGRLAAERPEVFEAPEPDAEAIARLDTVQGVLDSRSELLTAYQDVSYAAEYRAFVEETAKVVDATGAPDTAGYVRAVALTLARLMAYKDEYEVARLHSDPRFKESLKAQFEDGFKLAFHLSPPILARTDPKTGRPQKMRFGQWIQKVFLVLGKMKGLRGTAFDPFGYTGERREERALIQEYKDLIRQISPKVRAHNMGQAVALAEAAAQIRGYGPVKQESIARYLVDLPILLAAFAQQAEPAEHPSLVNA